MTKKNHDCLSKWCNGKAKVWSFSRSHLEMVIELTCEGKQGCLAIKCGDTQWYSGPMTWDETVLDLQECLYVDLAHDFPLSGWRRSEQIFILSDTKNSMELICATISFEEMAHKLWKCNS